MENVFACAHVTHGTSIHSSALASKDGKVKAVDNQVSQKSRSVVVVFLHC